MEIFFVSVLKICMEIAFWSHALLCVCVSMCIWWVGWGSIITFVISPQHRITHWVLDVMFFYPYMDYTSFTKSTSMANSSKQRMIKLSKCVHSLEAHVILRYRVMTFDEKEACCFFLKQPLLHSIFVTSISQFSAHWFCPIDYKWLQMWLHIIEKLLYFWLFSTLNKL